MPDNVYSPVSIPKKNNAGITKPKADIIIGRIRDVETFPVPDAKGINIANPVVMKSAAKLIKIGVTQSTINITQTTEGDPDNKGVKTKVEFERPGSDDAEFEEFLQGNTNEDLFVIIDYPLSGIKKIAGYVGNPMQLSAESTDTNEGDKHKITLESTLRGGRMRFYNAALPAIDGEAAPVPPAGSGSGGGQTV